ncbi:MAG: ABC transporter permease [Spirochaetae bacterium HGW-Spirochaetae-7]|jgi:lipoprotein-releasing system permease protein|nr:MAG: ABC transporter permease [Spirochaetae bacterium HGW-Spirochaetae-7]
MKGAPIAFVAARFFVGRRDAAGKRDQARKALVGAVLSVALSLVPLITVMQVADGMIQGISSRYVELGTYHAQAIPYASADLTGARDAARNSPGVSGAWLETQSVGVAFANGSSEGAAIRGVEPGFIADEATLAYLRVEGGVAALDRPFDALVGSAMAAKLGLAPGDPVNLITVRRSQDGAMAPRVTMLTVRGIVSAGYRDLDAQWLFMRQDTAARVLPRENTRSFVGIKAADPFGHPAAARDAVSGRLPAGFTVYAWRDVERNLFESLASTRTMLLLIMALTVAVAAVNVSSALTTLVLERGHEIAVLKSLGADSSDLARIFSLGGAAIGGMGAVIGSAGGLLASLRINEVLAFIERTANGARSIAAALSGGPAPSMWKVLDPAYYLPFIPVDVPFVEIVVVVAATVGLSYLAATGPANRAAALSPLEAFRKR